MTIAAGSNKKFIQGGTVTEVAFNLEVKLNFNLNKK
jgi:hypothetical protein